MTRTKKSPQSSAALDQARDELFSHIHRCGVLKASEEQQGEWMQDTVEYLGERYPDLDAEQLDELKEIGLRFCRPAKPYGADAEASESEAAAA